MRYLVIFIFLIISCKEHKPNLIEKKTYYEDGKLRSVYFTDKNDKMYGEAEVYYRSGNLKSSSTFENDKLIGVRNYYKDNEANSLGVVSLEINDSLRHVTVLFENGIKGQEGYQLDEKRIGKWFIYNSNGILTDSVNYGGKVPKFNLKN